MILDLQKYFLDNGLNLSKEKILKFEKFLEIFIEKNSVMNLSAIREENEILEKHFLDSLQIFKFLKLHGKILDLGIGGGFPGIPLAIFDENIEIIGLDSTTKKINALNEFAEKLSLKNFFGISGRAEKIALEKDFKESFDFITSRATAFLPVLIEYSFPFLKVGGSLISYKLQESDEIEKSEKILKMIGGKIENIFEYEISGQKRILIEIKKISKTPKSFPRFDGIALKNPIV